MKSFRNLRYWIKLLITPLIRSLYWDRFLISKAIRTALFHSAHRNALLFSSVGSEHYIVSSNDGVIGHALFKTGQYDLEKVERACSILKPDFKRTILIDVGANIGPVCIPAIQRNYFDYAIAFEPETFNYDLLVANVHLNHLSHRIETHNLAIGPSEEQELMLELAVNNYGAHSVVCRSLDGGSPLGTNATRVKSKPLDFFAERVDPLGTLVWIDAEGFEGHILEGAHRVLALRPTLVLEFCPGKLMANGSYDSLKHSIARAGYRTYFDLNYGLAPVSLSQNSLDELCGHLDSRGLSQTDLLIH